LKEAFSFSVISGISSAI